ncbi:MAG: terminase [Bacteroidaceae bacterium]|nr:terminase [Bacteroidaceae bacterium]
MSSPIKSILNENKRRVAAAKAPFNPLTGLNSTGERRKVRIKGLPVETVWLPEKMLENPFISALIKHGVEGAIRKTGREPTEESIADTIELYIRTRARYDFCFWCAAFVKIKPKGGGDLVPFVLRPAQRKLVEQGLHEDEVLQKALRLIILKARQWGGSTCIQLYFCWLQLVHERGLNSLICAQVKDTAIEIMDMFYTALKEYPVALLHDIGDNYDAKETKWEGVLNAQNIHKVPQRSCKIKVGTVEKPDSCRGGDYNLIHFSEVGVWKKTEGKSPEDIVDSASGGMGLDPLTMIVYESTAKGTGTFFHREWQAAKDGVSQFRPLFIPWYDITDRYWKEFDDNRQKVAFAEQLYDNRLNRNTNTNREESGEYLWWLWEKGASLEAINWYIQERTKYNDHAHMASEYPSDDIEAFVHSGARVFDKYHVENFRAACRPPRFIGDVSGKALKGKDAFADLHFTEDRQGVLHVWHLPEKMDGERCAHRYLVVVDIGGRSRKADFSVIAVFDRSEMADGGKPVIAAQWRGHTDHDLLAWKAAQIAAFYDNALLVIESNTLETKDRDRSVDGDQSGYILNQIKNDYPNLYARQRDSDSIKEGDGTRYGFHTNVKTKDEIISNLVECVRDRLYIERSELCLDEYLTYEETANGTFQAIQGMHDDILMTRAIGLWICFRVMERPYWTDDTQRRYTCTVNI